MHLEETHEAQGENAHRQAPGRMTGSNPELACCKATQLTTAPLCHRLLFLLKQNTKNI